jgi:hypothetical protein
MDWLFDAGRAGPETFAQAGEGLSTAEMLADPEARRLWQEDFSRLISSAFEQSRFAESSNAISQALEEEYDRQNETIKAVTGVDLGNPMRIGSRSGVSINPDRAIFPTFLPEADTYDRDQARADWLKRVQELKAGNKELSGFNLMDPQEGAYQRMRDAEARLGSAMGSNRLGATSKLFGQLVGGIGAVPYDPLQVATLAIGAGPSAARTVLGRVGATALREGAVNAAGTALLQPSVQRQRAEAGLEAGFGQAAENIAMGALIGGTLGAGGRALVEAGGALMRRAASAATAPAIPQAPETALPEARPVPAAATPESSVSRQAELAIEADEAFPPAPGDELADASELMLQQQLRALESADAPPPVPLPPPGPKAGMDLADGPAAAMRAVPEPGDTITLAGRPAAVDTFDAASLKTDPVAFQYKGGGDAEGVTDRLAGIQQWERMAAGTVVVFERSDGVRFVADGHQRTGLARRLKSAGLSDKTEITGFLLKEKDGWTPQDVRAIAAKKNLQEGSGSALDAARVLRDRPELYDASLPLSSTMIRQAKGLASLSDAAFGLVLNERVKPEHAWLVGAMVPDPALHGSIMADLAKVDDLSETRARFMIRDQLAAGTIEETQTTLFGAEAFSRSLMPERAGVFDQAQKLMRRDKQLFGALTENSERLDAINALVPMDRAAAQAGNADVLIDLVGRLANRTGEVSAALNRAARAVAEGTASRTEAGKGFVDEVRRLLQEGRLGVVNEGRSVMTGPVIEPGKPEAKAQADMLQSEMVEGVGEQTLLPGVNPVTDAERIRLEQNRPLTGGNAEPGGLFDLTADEQQSLFGDITGACKS